MKRIFIFLFLFVAVLAADDSKYFTATMTNGRAWGVMDLTGRLQYIHGLIDMKSMWQATHPAEADIYTLHGTYGEGVKLLDQFYDDPANADVPVVYALVYAKAKVEGHTPAELQTIAAGLRKMASELNRLAAQSSN